jgi:hypothetical protein
VLEDAVLEILHWKLELADTNTVLLLLLLQSSIHSASRFIIHTIILIKSTTRILHANFIINVGISCKEESLGILQFAIISSNPKLK